MSRLRRITLRLAIAATAILIADQIVQWTALRDGWLLGRRIAPFDPPVFIHAQLDTLERLRTAASDRFGDVVFDDELGWCTPPAGSPGVDRFGGRLGLSPPPTVKSPDTRRIAVFGCSFTYGSEVDGAAAWTAQLDDLRTDLEFVNLGVPGFGPDQALLRMRREITRTDADEVWLGFLPATALRLVSMYRPALRHYTETVATKPRFVLEDTSLVLVPQPAKSVSDLVNLIEDPQRFAELVRHDSFMRPVAAAYATDGSHLSHYFAVSRMALTLLDRRNRDWRPRFADATDETRRIATAVVHAFASETTRSRRTFRLILLPDRESLAPARTEEPAWRSFVDDLRAAGITVHEVTDALERAGGSSDETLWAPHGHYSPRGNRIVADALVEGP